VSRESRKQMGLAPQELAVYPELTARENLEFFGRLYGTNSSRLSQRADEVLREIGLTAQANGLVAQLSGGMKRRLNFGVALMHQPSLLILDEPTVGVDPQSRNHLLDCVRKEAARGAAVVYASHYMVEVAAICHRVAIIDRGKPLAIGPLDELLGRLTPEISLRVRDLSAAARVRLGSQVRCEILGSGQAEVRLIFDANGAADSNSNRELRRVLEILDAERSEVLSIETHRANLERLFLELTGRILRD
jgi:ABC-2 type transport system ATP-binding protein